LLRPHQWVKNCFVAAPLFFTPGAVTTAAVVDVVLGMISFCTLASAVYILNDYLDRDADRQHPAKRTRPLAAGTVGVGAALALMVTLAFGGLALAATLSTSFAAIMSGYLVNNLLYSLWLKHVAIVDVFMIALGFLLRVAGGAVLAQVQPSVWITIMTGLLALFLALAKRRDDVVLGLGSDQRGSLDGYNKPFIDAALTVLLSALTVAYLIYTTDQTVAARFGTSHLVLTAPFVCRRPGCATFRSPWSRSVPALRPCWF
jgi:4-hydroxybenzoate polyprenyltransferase